MATQRRLEPHPFVPYADASHICKHCDGGEFAECHEERRVMSKNVTGYLAPEEASNKRYLWSEIGHLLNEHEATRHALLQLTNYVESFPGDIPNSDELRNLIVQSRAVLMDRNPHTKGSDQNAT